MWIYPYIIQAKMTPYEDASKQTTTKVGLKILLPE